MVAAIEEVKSNRPRPRATIGGNLRDIGRAAFFDTGEQLRAPIARTLLAGLNNRPRPACPRPRQPAA
jgi:hypothetical protein